MDSSWVEHFSGSIVICDWEGIILEMNEKACAMFQKDGGRELIGKSLLASRQGAARDKPRDAGEANLQL